MKSYKIQVNGKSYDVTVEETGVPSSSPQSPSGAPASAARTAPAAPAAGAAAPAASAPQAKTLSAQVKASMPGTLRGFKVKVGQAVKAGEVILILEAMKMENEIVAPVDGVVTALLVSEGASVNTGEALATIG